MEPVSRREFIKRSAGLAAGVTAAASMLAGGRRAVAADEEIRVAVVGINGQGNGHIRTYLQLEGVRIVALCDPDESLWKPRAEQIVAKYGYEPRFYYDIRDLLDSDDVDAISIATPNHWHALATIWACQAGKDVYVEKPASWCFTEGQKMVEAAAKYGRVVQHGTQSRSDSTKRDAVARLWAGEIGDVYMARALCFKPRPSIGFKEPKNPPAHLHWDIWRGPAPQQPYHENLVHYNWHWFWDFGNGDLGNQGVHQMDVARWGLGKTLPSYVHSRGGRLGYRDQGETPNTQVCNFEFDDGKQLVFEVRGLPSNDERDVKVGNSFYGSDGWMSEGDGFKSHMGYDGAVRDPMDPSTLPSVGGKGPDNPFRNFLEVVRSRDLSQLNAPIVEGHLSSAFCHLAMISYRLRRALVFDPEKGLFVDDDEANSMLSRQEPRSSRGARRPVRNPFRVPDRV